MAARINHCHDYEDCTFQVTPRGAGCQWEHCTDPTADGITACTDGTVSMHEDCWRGYDHAWRHNHADAVDDMAAAAESAYFASGEGRAV